MSYFKSWSIFFVAKNKNNPDNTCGTALLHEYGHCIRQELGFSTKGDDHWDDEFWDIVAEAQKVSCDRNWAQRDILEEMDYMIEHYGAEYDYSIYLE